MTVSEEEGRKVGATAGGEMVGADVREYMRLVAAHPSDPWLRLELGRVLLDKGQVDNALHEFDRAGQAHGYWPRSRLLAARARLARGEGSIARAELRAALPALRGEERREAFRLFSRSLRATSCERTEVDLPFAADLIAAVRFASDEARWSWSPVRPGHFLTGLVRETRGNGGALLRSLDLRPADLRRCMQQVIEREYPRRRAGQDLRARELLTTARSLASRQSAGQVRGEHLLLALLDTADVPLLLQQLGTSAARVQEELSQVPKRRAFSASARAALEAAQSEVFNAGQRMVGTAHLLLGLLRDDGPTGKLLRSHGLDAERTRRHLLEESSSRGPGSGSVMWGRVRPGLPSCEEATPRCRQLLRGAQRVCERSSAPTIAPWHLLAALLELPRCIALQLLSDQGVDLEVLEGQVLAEFTQRGRSEATKTVVPAIPAEQREGPLPALPCFAEPPVGYQRTPRVRALGLPALPTQQAADVEGEVGFNWVGVQAVLSVLNVVLAWFAYYHYCGLFGTN